MGRKSNNQRAIDLLRSLTPDELQKVLDEFQLGAPANSYESVEGILSKKCPVCHSLNHQRYGKTKKGLTVFKCKDCGRKFNILSGTPLEKTPYSWNVWVSILEKMLNH